MTVVTPLPILIALGLLAAVSLFYTGAALNRMTAATDEGIRWSLLTRGFGLFVLVFASLDSMQDDPYTWPWTLLLGTVLTVAGTTGLYIFSRRSCHCPECPVRLVRPGAKECDESMHISAETRDLLLLIALMLLVGFGGWIVAGEVLP